MPNRGEPQETFGGTPNDIIEIEVEAGPANVEVDPRAAAILAAPLPLAGGKFLALFPISLGGCIWALNVFVVARLAHSFWQNTAAVTLVITSSFIGLILLLYTLLLLRFERRKPIFPAPQARFPVPPGFPARAPSSEDTRFG